MEQEELLFPACVVNNEKLYAVTHDTRTIIQLDLREKKIHYIASSMGSSQGVGALMDKLAWHHDRLYLFEYGGNVLYEFSCLDKQMRRFKINAGGTEGQNIASCIFLETYLYVFPNYKTYSIRIDLENGGMTKVPLQFSQLINDKEENWAATGWKKKMISSVCYIEDKAWIFSEKSREVVQYDFKKKKQAIYEMPLCISGCVHAAWGDEVFYVLNEKGEVYGWIPESGKAECVLHHASSRYQYPYFFRLIFAAKKIWLIPFVGEHIYTVDLRQNNRYEKYEDYPEDLQRSADPQRSRFYEYCDDENFYYFAMHSYNRLFVIDKRNGAAKWLKFEENWGEKAEFYKKNRYFTLVETEKSLDNYLKLLVHMGNETEESSDKEWIKTGNTIWEENKSESM